jgi:hypothetical protein
MDKRVIFYAIVAFAVYYFLMGGKKALGGVLKSRGQVSPDITSEPTPDAAAAATQQGVPGGDAAVRVSTQEDLLPSSKSMIPLSAMENSASLLGEGALQGIMNKSA